LPEDTLIWREGENAWQPAYKKLGLDPLNLPDVLVSDPASDDAPLVPQADSERPAPPLFSQDNEKTVKDLGVAVLVCSLVLAGLTLIGLSCS